MKYNRYLLLFALALFFNQCTENTASKIQESVLKHGYLAITKLTADTEAMELSQQALRYKGAEYQYAKKFANDRYEEAERYQRNFLWSVYDDLDSTFTEKEKLKFLEAANIELQILYKEKAKTIETFKDVFRQFNAVKMACSNIMGESPDVFIELLNQSYIHNGKQLKNSVTHSSFVDKRDNKTYKTVTIGKQTWMAENLAFEGYGTKLTNEKQSTKWGETYWKFKDYNDENKHLGVMYDYIPKEYNIAPEGWRVADQKDWRELEQNLIWMVGLDSTGTALKSTSGWLAPQDTVGNGTDNFGFNIVPMKASYGKGSGTVRDKGMTDYRLGRRDYWGTIVFHTDNNRIGKIKHSRDFYCIRCVKNN